MPTECSRDLFGHAPECGETAAFARINENGGRAGAESCRFGRNANSFGSSSPEPATPLAVTRAS